MCACICRYWQDKAGKYEQQLLRKTCELEQLQATLRQQQQQQRSKQQQLMSQSWDGPVARPAAPAAGPMSFPTSAPASVVASAAASAAPSAAASCRPSLADGLEVEVGEEEEDHGEEGVLSDAADFQSVCNSPEVSPESSPNRSSIWSPQKGGSSPERAKVQQQQQHPPRPVRHVLWSASTLRGSPVPEDDVLAAAEASLATSAAPSTAASAVTSAAPSDAGWGGGGSVAASTAASSRYASEAGVMQEPGSHFRRPAAEGSQAGMVPSSSAPSGMGSEAGGPDDGLHRQQSLVARHGLQQVEDGVFEDGPLSSGGRHAGDLWAELEQLRQQNQQLVQQLQGMQQQHQQQQQVLHHSRPTGMHHHHQQQQLPPLAPQTRTGPRHASLMSVGSITGSVSGQNVLGRYSSLHKRGGSMDMGEWRCVRDQMLER